MKQIGLSLVLLATTLFGLVVAQDDLVIPYNAPDQWANWGARS